MNNERILILIAFAALLAIVALACGIGWTYAMPEPNVDRSHFDVLR